MTIKQKLNACYKVLFKNKPITTVTYGVRVIKCDDCEYNLKCEECFVKTTVKEIAVDAYSKFAERLKAEFRDNTDNNGDINSCLVPIIIDNLLTEMAGNENGNTEEDN